jgi:hypothetical protein
MNARVPVKWPTQRTGNPRGTGSASAGPMHEYRPQPWRGSFHGIRTSAPVTRAAAAAPKVYRMSVTRGRKSPRRAGWAYSPSHAPLRMTLRAGPDA